MMACLFAELCDKLLGVLGCLLCNGLLQHGDLSLQRVHQNGHEQIDMGLSRLNVESTSLNVSTLLRSVPRPTWVVPTLMLRSRR